MIAQNRFERFCAWNGIPAIVLFFGGFAAAGFVPPPSPSLSPAQVAAFYQTHVVGVRIGMLLMLLSGMFMAPFIGAISVQMRRIQGISPALSYAQISAGTTNTMFFFIPAVIFLVTAYRPERAPELTYMLNDLGWIFAVLPVPPAMMQCLVMGLAALADTGKIPVFPRWFGYLNIFVAIGYIPSLLLVYFTAGPLTWRGILVFWLGGTLFVVWFITTVYAVLASINRSENDFTGGISESLSITT